MQKHDIAAAVHQRWAEADVLLTSATFAYYKERNIVERLQQDIIAPARAQGYQHIWLAGASIGGMGVLFYEHEHPGELDRKSVVSGKSVAIRLGLGGCRTL